MFLYAMIAFVTNLGAPLGVIWKGVFYNNAHANTIGMLGNAMNFLAYLFMGIPAGNMLVKFGYKKTALIGIATGFVGVFIQYSSGLMETGVPGFVVYLVGAFVSGFSVCMLNTVVNPMLNLIGGGGNRGNQLNLIGGTLNSLAGTLTPMLVGALIGQVVTMQDVINKKEIIVNGVSKIAEAGDVTQMSQVSLVMYIAMAVFALAFIVLCFIPIEDPDKGKSDKNTVFEHSPWAFRHFKLGVIAIFLYVGVETGIPGTLNFFVTDTLGSSDWTIKVVNAATIGGFVAGTYWLLMLVGRLIASFIGGKVSSKTMMICTNVVGMLLIVIAMLTPKTVTASIPLFTGSSFQVTLIPLSAVLLVLCGLCTSIMWSSIFNLSTEGLGKYTAKASGIFMMMVVGGGLMPLIQNFIADLAGYMVSYIVPLLSMGYMLFYAVVGSKNVNKDIPVE